MELDIDDVLASLQRQIGEYARQVAQLEAIIAQLQTPPPVPESTTISADE